MSKGKDITLIEMLSNTVRRFPGRHALVWTDGSMTYTQLEQATDEMAAGLLLKGMKKGERAALWASESPALICCMVAILKTGAVPVFLNTSWTAQEVEEALRITQASWLFYDSGYKNVDYKEIRKHLHLPKLVHFIYMGSDSAGEDPGLSDLHQKGREELEGFNGHVMKQDLAKAKAAVLPEDDDMIIFTSGSVGSPKAVLTSHASRTKIAFAQVDMLDLDENDISCVATPVFHCFSLASNVLGSFAVGACVCLPRDRHTDHLFEAVQQWHCTILTAVPTLYSAMIHNPRIGSYDLSSLRAGVIGGSLCPEYLFRQIEETLHMTLVSSLGQTEATAAITGASTSDSLHIRANTVGKFIQGIEGVIKDVQTGQILPCGLSGEICLRGFNVMKEYVGQPDLTAQVIDRDGFLHTGDLAFVDEDGYVHLTGRLKELIIRGGENIAPGEVEGVIIQSRKVAGVKVLGVSDPHYGEEVCACVSPAEGAELTQEEIKEMVREKLAAYKVPRYVVLLDKMPLKANGKPDLSVLRKMAQEAGVPVQGAQSVP